ncbi:MAG TPA: flagellar basal body P-ring protein FlgI [bacterium]|nr:flagellar basal body P-ring protein FlgI [bacterium]
MVRLFAALILIVASTLPAYADGAVPPPANPNGLTGADRDPEVSDPGAGAEGAQPDGATDDSTDKAGADLSQGRSALLAQSAPRLKDIGRLNGLRTNQLYGIGLVTGLAGTGDDLGAAKFTAQMVANYLQRQGVTADAATLKAKNFAAVTITAEIPPFVQVGDTIDITVAAMGTSKSLEGGQLILTPLKAANGQVYAAAQGPITLGAFGATAAIGGARASAQKNFLTVGRIPNGATIERPVASDLPTGRSRMEWALQENDFTTAQRAAAALNQTFRGAEARAEDGQRISFRLPAGYPGTLVDFLAQVEQVQVQTDMPARIVLNERNGTIVAGANVRIKPVSVAHGSLTVTVVEGFGVSQPHTPFGGGRTRVVPGAQVEVTEGEANVQAVTTVQDLLDGVAGVGGSIRDLVAILQALKAAGALDAELVVI